jgi:hypothetical protein
VYFIGSAIDRVNVQELLERFDRPVGEMTTHTKKNKKNSINNLIKIHFGGAEHGILPK